ncbi:heavy-metal-associated domain-containing protein [Brachybacterium huguangmaarense]
MSTTTTYGVTGLTCGHCVAAVTEEVSELPGVESAQVELVTGGTSLLTVVSEEPVDRADLTAAIAEAGEAYTLTDD